MQPCGDELLSVPRSPMTSTGLLSFAARDTCSSIATNDGASPMSAVVGGALAATVVNGAKN